MKKTDPLPIVYSILLLDSPNSGMAILSDMNRHIITKKYYKDYDDGYVEGSQAERISMVWEITRDVWSFTGKGDAERRLQRDVANIIRPKG